MVAVDPEIGTSAVRLWLAAGSATLLVAAVVLAVARPRLSAFGPLLLSGFLALGAILATSMVWAFLGQPPGHDQDAGRQALEMRAQELTARTLEPGSSLACLSGLAGETLETACEKALFASPATVATAISYEAARFTLLADVVAYAKRGGTGVDEMLLPLRRSLESDRFGFLAQALATGEGCTSQSCKALDLLPDARRVRANLSSGTLDHYLEQYQTVWAQTPETPVADVDHGEPSATAQLVPLSQRKVLVNIDFPSAASIPPVSIMNPEPTGPLPGAAASALRRARKPATNTPAAEAAGQGAAGTPSAAQAQVDPVWRPTAPAAQAAAPIPQAAPPAPHAATAGAPTANLAAGAGEPVQLNPFSSSQ
jgi:hypothetical protein